MVAPNDANPIIWGERLEAIKITDYGSLSYSSPVSGE